ncbi:MAG: hypothetical protein EAZ89_12875 [Bacteroidetes bacterium]|nr:MAG: hypothetical protein EAZ89_12875 [Bacteroidota bacterium]
MASFARRYAAFEKHGKIFTFFRKASGVYFCSPMGMGTDIAFILCAKDTHLGRDVHISFGENEIAPIFVAGNKEDGLFAQ